MFNIGDLVVIINDINNYIYKIKDISDKVCLIGYSYRLIKYVNINEIKEAPKELILEENKINEKQKSLVKNNVSIRNKKALFGRILHIDGDKEYLESCMSLYKELGIYAEGVYIAEKELGVKIEKLLLNLTPDIVVITGHDAFKGENKASLDSYENSKYFIKAIRIIRKHYSLDNVVIIAGACGSHFEALIASGANFASSPKRINTHTYDPAIAAIKVASTSIAKLVDFNNILKYIDNGRDAIGGIETKGKMRLLL
jgi:spore coat assembly protein